MVYTQRDIQKLVNHSYPGMTYEEQKKTLRGIMGAKDGNFLPVEPKVQAFIDWCAERYMSDITDKGPCKSVEDEKRRCIWHAFYEDIANRWDDCQARLDAAGIRITE